jgi:hypothetical protein
MNLGTEMPGTFGGNVLHKTRITSTASPVAFSWVSPKGGWGLQVQVDTAQIQKAALSAWRIKCHHE